MKQRQRTVLALGLAVLLALPAATALAQKKLWYRYTDEQGQTVLDDHVPPEHTHRGYQVLNTQGQIVEEVPPAATEEDLAERRRERDAEREQARLAAWDASLLRRYSSVEDIEAARDRAIKEIEVRISILRSNLLSTKAQIEREQSRAADLERRGIAVPEELTDTLQVLKEEIDDIEQSVAARREEIEDVKADYQRDIERFEILRPQVELRRKSYSERQRDTDEY